LDAGQFKVSEEKKRMSDSKQIDDGGPSFPSAETRQNANGDFSPGFAGMSLRDWFAGQALAGLSTIEDLTTFKTAKIAYDIADEMIFKLNEKQ
tara:strand:+ start:1689 stop:1967 length:279 start_codon:yes stop_codon:yes gene_type:complete